MLTAAELEQLEATLLPTLERHHLRLLAHALRTLQAIAAEATTAEGQTPAEGAIEHWLRAQPAIADDDGFVATFSLQLQAAALQLQAIAAARGVGPLALTLNDLSAWATDRADARLRVPGACPPPD